MKQASSGVGHWIIRASRLRRRVLPGFASLRSFGLPFAPADASGGHIRVPNGISPGADGVLQGDTPCRGIKACETPLPLGSFLTNRAQPFRFFDPPIPETLHPSALWRRVKQGFTLAITLITNRKASQ